MVSDEIYVKITDLKRKDGKPVIFLSISKKGIEKLKGINMAWACTIAAELSTKMEVISNDERTPEHDTMLESCNCACHGEEP